MKARWQEVRAQDTPERADLAEELLDELYLLVAEPELGESPLPIEEACRGCEELLPRLVERLRRVEVMRRVLAGPAATETPPQIPGYVILGEIDRGGQGIVYKALDLSLKREVAVKVLPEPLRHLKRVLRRFQVEAQVCSQLRHPGIVAVHALGELPDGGLYYVMELVRGETLARHLEGPKTPAQQQDRWLRAFEQVCQAMAYAHSRGVLHRDLKPSNIMLAQFNAAQVRDWVQVMDWGLAKIFGKDAGGDEPEVLASREAKDDLTQQGEVWGTPLYMSPEQALGDISGSTSARMCSPWGRFFARS
jgi:serine/threonine protein kinase